MDGKRRSVGYLPSPPHDAILACSSHNADFLVGIAVLASIAENAKTGTNPRVTTCLENLEMSGKLTAVGEMSKSKQCPGKNLVREKLLKAVYCKLHICVHTVRVFSRSLFCAKY